MSRFTVCIRTIVSAKGRLVGAEWGDGRLMYTRTMNSNDTKESPVIIKGPVLIQSDGGARQKTRLTKEDKK